MRKISQAAVVFLFVVLAAATAYAGLFSNSWRYKMTVTVETPEGIKTGSAVREVFSHRVFNLTLGWVERYKINGEAIAVDLGSRGVLFALMKGGIYNNDYAKSLYVDLYVNERHAGKRVLPFEQWPKFITFKDPKDPKTIQSVFVTEWDGRFPLHFTVKSDDTEKLFGRGVKIKEVSIEPTREAVSVGIDHYLPSFGAETEFHEWILKLRYGDPRIVTTRNFKVIEEK